MEGKGLDHPLGSDVAIVLALFALTLAVIVMSLSRDPQWMRISALCLAVGAMFYSLMVV